MRVECRTQAEMEAAIDAGNTPVCIEGRFILAAGMHVEARGSSHVEARGSSHVVSWESSHVEAWGSSHVVAWGSSHVVAWESSHVEAWGSVIVRVFSCASVIASLTVTVVIHGCKDNVTGGVQIEVKPPKTAVEWCDYYGAEVDGGVAILFKGLEAGYKSPHGFDYSPGTTPIAPDWDGGKKECGGGLHFSPHPLMTHEFIRDPKHYVACPVRLEDISVHPEGEMPQKVKARGCCGPVWEVDRYGRRIEVAPVETAAN